MKDVKDIRNKIKPLGFNIRTYTNSQGKHVVYLKGTAKMPSIMTAFELKQWQPLINWLKSNAGKLNELKRVTGIYGLNPTR